MGFLTIKGTLDITKLWPDGESDADTSKVLVTVGPKAMSYKPQVGKAKDVSKIYDNAFLDKALKKPVVEKGVITVRLQGIDAPELHYQPQTDPKLGSLAKSKNNGVQVVFKFRQAQGETATVALGDRLKKAPGQPAVRCSFVTQLDDNKGPAEAIDKYGRFVGDIMVGNTNLNHWLLEQGIAVVSLYNSLEDDELRAYLKAWSTGNKKGIARLYSKKVLPFDPTLILRKKGSKVVSEGNKRFILPKLYRRQTTWFAYHKLNKFQGDLQAFLQTKDDSDRFFEIDDFLDNGLAAVQHPFSLCVKDAKQMTRKPDEIVFKEAASALYATQGGQAKKITSW